MTEGKGYYENLPICIKFVPVDKFEHNRAQSMSKQMVQIQ